MEREDEDIQRFCCIKEPTIEPPMNMREDGNAQAISLHGNHDYMQ
jgi:hypothetical protein